MFESGENSNNIRNVAVDQFSLRCVYSATALVRRPTAGRGDSWGAWHYIACRQVPKGERAAAASRQTAIDADTVYSYSTRPPSDGSGQKRRLLATGRGEKAKAGDDADTSVDAEPTNVWGLVTNIHLSDLAIEGTLESMEDVLCPFRHLRELDLDGGEGGRQSLVGFKNTLGEFARLKSLDRGMTF